MNVNRIILPAMLVLSLAACRRSGGPVYLDPSKDIEERVEDALSRMTLEEKVGMLHAQSKFSSKGVPRLGIPEVWCDDGPHGVRPETFWDASPGSLAPPCRRSWRPIRASRIRTGSWRAITSTFPRNGASRYIVKKETGS